MRKDRTSPARAVLATRRVNEAEPLAARLPSLLAAAKRIAAGMTTGIHGRRKSGMGETFWQYRRAQPGDSVSAIDWRRSARAQEYYVRENEWASAQTVWIWADASPSMHWRSHPSLPLKSERAVILALALSALLLRGGERVAAMNARLAPQSGSGALERLALAWPDNDAALPSPGGVSRGASVVLISDFLHPVSDLETCLQALASTGVSGHLLQVLDPAEETLPFNGRVRFVGPEGEGEFLARRAEDLASDYASALAAQRDGLARLARAWGWSLALHGTQSSPQTALLALSARLTQRLEPRNNG